jgi:hypothetical protein
MNMPDSAEEAARKRAAFRSKKLNGRQQIRSDRVVQPNIS